MSLWVTKFFSAFLLPPLNFLILGIAGFVLLKRRPQLGKCLIGATLALLWVCSVPAVGSSLLALLERDAHTPVEQFRDAQAIVVLASGIYLNAPEYGEPTVSGTSLERLRLAAYLYRRTGLPLLVTGGIPRARGIAVSSLMKAILEKEFGVPTRWTEVMTENTLQHAVYSMKLLAPTNVRTIVLVTHGWHMPRAKRVFESAGFRVLPAGTGFQRNTELSVRNFLPSLWGLNASAIFMHEVIGLLWYRSISMLE